MVSTKTLLAVAFCVVAVETFYLAVTLDWPSSIKFMATFVMGFNQSEETQNATVPKVASQPMDVHLEQPLDVHLEQPLDAHLEQPLDVYLEQRAIRVKEVNCQKLFQGHKKALREASTLEKKPVPIPTDNQIKELASNCSHFVDHYRFLLRPLTRLEEEFSIAYSLLIYKQASQVVDLLRAIYRPQNWYCVHVDRKYPPSLRQAMEAVSRCFPNVFLASRAVDVRWGSYSVLEPELVCMEDLWRRNGTWKYFINLTGQEFPIKTNYELVRILSAFQGANNVESIVPERRFINYRWKKFLPTPHNIALYRGGVHIAVSRGFVDYVLHSPIALEFRQWCKPTRHPDEHFFNSLNHNPHLRVPGGAKSPRGRSGLVNPSVARFKVWKGGPCPGRKFVHQICIFNVLDLPRLRSSDAMFANKFYVDYSRLALQCLTEEMYNRTREQALGRLDFNATFYGQLSFVKNRLS